MQQIKVSENFKKMTLKAIGSIVLFIVTYFVLVILAVALTILCGILGFALVSSKINSITIMLSIGLVSMGILILIFLVKFIFKRHVTDLSHLTEITRNEEPALFRMIEDIVKEVQTDFPKKVYLSTDVNASVFYDSSFWSMFLPVKKNLQIGVGLVNTVSVIELKAILAHEFGHFSQRTMKVGSYVYNMNQIIYNMLYDNESYDSLAQKWASGGNIIMIFVTFAVKIVQGIQWILKKVYDVLNLSYMSLSREMEFHADEVAAHVAGSRPLINSLLRMDLADQSYNAVLNYYQSKINDAVTSQNIYPQQEYVMKFLAEKNKLPFENNLPQVSQDHLSRYNKSKLVITNQWASHPSTEDRIHQLEKLNLETRNYDTKPASALFTNMADLQKSLTDKLFSSIQYSTDTVVQSGEEFINDFLEEQRDNSFDEIYNSYYDYKNPSAPDDDQNSLLPSDRVFDLKTLFSNESVDEVYTLVSLEGDINNLRQISEGNSGIKSFDYDGIKYSPTDCPALITELESKVVEVKDSISRNDSNIYKYFLQLAEQQGKEDVLKGLYQSFFNIDQSFDDKFGIYIKMLNTSNFIFQTTPIEVISENLKILKEAETEFKKEIKFMLTEERFRASLTEEIKANFEDYLSGFYIFFYDQSYKQEELSVLFNTIKNYQTVLSKTHFIAKKQLLDYQVSLVRI
ncbi:M48 family metallopeptidase [Dyadobacter subterraneus]|uniref:M48 family metalloprotease n=1 Tax=Dyadobacter subterraneus TaxID=2773304 RepID=A0ABR9WM99_9BACT|nr:M48 family metallopeptidase [Dyadobacter subterraneus]MBE9466488.1 M48 family metalloprotease [Dyadobacter subterraneus]